MPLLHTNGRGAEALALEIRGPQSNAIDVSRRDAGGFHQANEERIEICALAPEVAGFQHGPDVSYAAPAHLRIAMRVVDDPLVDCVRLLYVRRSALGDLIGLRLHNAVCRHVARPLQKLRGILRERTLLSRRRVPQGDWPIPRADALRGC